MNLAHWVWRQAQQNGQRPALYLGRDLVATYQEFQARAAAFAGWLLAQGFGKGARVALYMNNVVDYLPALYGIWAAGAVAVPINAKLHAREVSYVLENSGARCVIATPQHAAVLSELSFESRVIDLGDGLPQAAPIAEVAARAPDDLAWLFYTSGTTGRPKGVQITHGMLALMALSYHSDVDAVGAEDCTIYAAPLSHGAGLYSIMHVQHGARHIFPASGGFDPSEVLDLAAFHGHAHMFAAPTLVTRMTACARARGRHGEGLRTIVYAGAPMYLSDIKAARATFGSVFVQIYGQGECPMAISVLPRAVIADSTAPGWEARLGSVGVAQSCVEIKIGDEAGQALAEGEVGEVMVRGATVMPGYWRAPEATAQTLQDGWLRTGDIGRLDAAGYLTLLDRSKDVIISGGSNVYPREVEDVLLMHPDVREAAVIGRAHPDWGEAVVAVIVGEATAQELEALCAAHIARFKHPKAYEFIDALPKNNTGKVLKTELRQRFDRQV